MKGNPLVVGMVAVVCTITVVAAVIWLTTGRGVFAIGNGRCRQLLSCSWPCFRFARAAQDGKLSHYRPVWSGGWSERACRQPVAESR